MNALVIRIAVLALPFLVVIQPARGQSRKTSYLCESPSLSLSLPPGAPPETISPAFFVSTRLRDSSGGLTFHNTFKRRVMAFELLVQYMGAGDQPSVRIPFFAVAAESRDRFRPILHSETNRDLKKGLPPGKSFHTIGESFTLVTSCPTKATIVFLRVLLDDMQTAEWHTDNWETEPLIREIPLTIDFSCDSVGLGVHPYLVTAVNSEGRVSKVEVLAPPRWSCLESLRKALEPWIFYPALKNGKPSNSQFNILLHLNRKPGEKQEDYEVSPEEITRPTVVVDFVRADPNATEWSVMYGPQPFGFIPPVQVHP